MRDKRERLMLGPQEIFSGGGEMGMMVRSFDWAKTPLGPVEGWPQALRMMVGLLLRNRFPLLLWWGPHFIQIYNDAYRPIPGAKHPQSLGQPAQDCWAEIWHILGPMIEAPFRGEPATASEDLTLLINRKGFLEETHFKVAYSPVPDETVTPTRIGGVLATVAETTQQIYGERQLQTLRELAARAAVAKTPEQACETAALTLKENPYDIPFALFYLVDSAGKQAKLAASNGFVTSGLANPAVIDLENSDVESEPWSLGKFLKSFQPRVFTDLTRSLGPLPSGHWSESPDKAIALPLAVPDQRQAYGVVIFGLNPHRALDEGYRTFFELAAGQVTTAIRNASAFQEERKRSEALAELDRAKTAFFSNVSHEFRTPLALMLGPLEELKAEFGKREPGFTAAQYQQIDLVHRNGLRLLKLVNTLLDFARIEAGRVEAVYEATDLAAYTKELAGVFRSAIEKAGLKFIVECPPLPEMVYVDRSMWEKIVLNLLSNAFKFTFEGEIKVAVRWCEERVELSVSDTGAGIPAEQLPRIFERFYRARTVRSRTHEGTGIGLALVQELVRLHGGEASVQSSLGHGSTFVVTIQTGTTHLPKQSIDGARSIESTAIGAFAFVEEALRWLPGERIHALPTVVEQRTPPNAQPPTPRSGPVASDKPLILVADDNADMREYLWRLLATRYEVIAVSDGEAALAAARQQRPDLLLSDVMMPRLDGFALLQALREDPLTKTLPIILLSARAGEESRVEGLEASADDYLIKPFSARELLARVGTHLELARLRKNAQETLEKTVQERTAELQEALQDLKTYSYSITHDLRAPLRAMHGFASMLAEDCAEQVSGVGQDYIRRIIASAARMDALIRDVLRYSSAMRGELPLQPVDLMKLVEGILESYPTFQAPSAQIHIEGKLPVVIGNEAALTQCVSNLVGNAVQFVAPGTVPSVRIWAERADTGRVRIWFEDNGIGIAKEHLEETFGIFKRLNNSHEGTGIGLAIVRKAVERMGGTMGVESELGQGSRFWLELNPAPTA